MWQNESSCARTAKTFKGASVFRRWLSEPTVSADDEARTSDIYVAIAVLAVCSTLGLIGLIFTIP
jgi:hypothetical protein